MRYRIIMMERYKSERKCKGGSEIDIVLPCDEIYMWVAPSAENVTHLPNHWCSFLQEPHTVNVLTPLQSGSPHFGSY